MDTPCIEGARHGTKWQPACDRRRRCQRTHTPYLFLHLQASSRVDAFSKDNIIVR